MKKKIVAKSVGADKRADTRPAPTRYVRGESAITLIALVITIIVLLILAGVTIAMVVGDNGILSRARESKSQTEIADEKERIQIAFSSLRIGKEAENDNSNIGAEELQNEINGDTDDTSVDGDSDLIVKYNKSGRYYAVLQDGTIIENGWIKTEEGITNGKVETPIQIGDKIGYNPGEIKESISLNKDETGYANLQNINLKNEGLNWIVIGVDDGKLLITTSLNVTESNVYLEGKIGYTKGIDTLNEIADLYGNGNGAEGARSITVEDINNVTGYNPETAKCDEGEIYGYGYELTYYWEGTSEYPTYKWKKGGEEQTGTLLDSHSSGFYWYDDNNVLYTSEKLTIESERKEITKLKNTRYYYYPQSLTTNSNEAGGISKETLIYTNLFNTGSYWLGSKCVFGNGRYFRFGLRAVSNETSGTCSVANSSLFNSNDTSISNGDLGVRPVVYLKSDINLKQNGENTWEIE